MGATVGNKKTTDWGFVLFMLSLVLMLIGGVMSVIVGIFFSDSTVFDYRAIWAAASPTVVGGVIFLVFFIIGMIRG